MSKFLDYVKANETKLLMSLFAFLFALISFIISFFGIVKIRLIGAEDYIIVTGVQLYFGEYFNVYALIGWLLILFSLILIPLSNFLKKIKGLQFIFIVVAILLFAFLPTILNAPSHETAEVLYDNVKVADLDIILYAFLTMSAILTLVQINSEIKFDVKELCEMAMLIAAAVVLNFVKIPLQWSGSVNLQIVPLVIIALRYKPSKTFIASGIVFGLITCLTDGYGLFAYPLEYLIAFGSVAIISPFRKLIIKDPNEMKSLDYILGLSLLIGLLTIQTTIRFICASVDSYVFYFAYLDGTTTGGNMINAALLYNAPYVYLTGVATIGVISALYYPLLLINKRFPGEK